MKRSIIIFLLEILKKLNTQFQPTSKMHKFPVTHTHTHTHTSITNCIQNLTCLATVVKQNFHTARYTLNRMHFFKELLHIINGKFNEIYSSPNIVRVIKSRRKWWAGRVARMGRGIYRVVLRKPKRKRPLGRPRRRWEDNIKMHLQKVGCGCMDWIDLAQDRDRWRALVNAVMNPGVP